MHLETRRGGGQRRRLQVEEPRRGGADDHVGAAEDLGRDRGRLALGGGERGGDDLGRRVAPVVAALRRGSAPAAGPASSSGTVAAAEPRAPGLEARGGRARGERREREAGDEAPLRRARRAARRRTTPSASGRRVTEPIPAAASRSAGSGGETAARAAGPAGGGALDGEAQPRVERRRRRRSPLENAAARKTRPLRADARRELGVRLLPPRREVVEEHVEEHRRGAAARAVLEQRVVEAARPGEGDVVALEVVEARLVDLDQHDPPVGALAGRRRAGAARRRP